MCPDFLLSRTPQIPRQKYTSEHLFIEQLPVASVKFQLFFKKGKKQKQFFIPPLCLIRLKSCNFTKIVKIVFIHDFEENYSNLSSVSFKFCNIKYGNHFACFHVMLTFSEFSYFMKCLKKYIMIISR